LDSICCTCGGTYGVSISLLLKHERVPSSDRPSLASSTPLRQSVEPAHQNPSKPHIKIVTAQGPWKQPSPSSRVALNKPDPHEGIHSCRVQTPASVFGRRTRPTPPRLAQIRQELHSALGPVHRHDRPCRSPAQSAPHPARGPCSPARSAPARPRSPESSAPIRHSSAYSAQISPLDTCYARAAAAGVDQGVLFDRGLPPQAEQWTWQGRLTRPDALSGWTPEPGN
jgi:hypothetical protein